MSLFYLILQLKIELVYFVFHFRIIERNYNYIIIMIIYSALYDFYIWYIEQNKLMSIYIYICITSIKPNTKKKKNV